MRGLFPRQGQSNDPAAEFGSGDLGEPAPAATDFQYAVTRLQVKFLGQASIFALLRRHDGFIHVGEHGRRIGHRLIEP